MNEDNNQFNNAGSKTNPQPESNNTVTPINGPPLSANDFFEPTVNGVRYDDGYFSSSPQQEIETKPHLHNYKAAAIILSAVIAVIAIGFLWSYIKTGDSNSLATYTISLANHKYNVLFYEDASGQTIGQGSSSVFVLSSQVIKRLEEPIEMSLSANSPVSSTSNNCSLVLGASNAFNVYMPGLKTEAHVCALMGLDYFSSFSAGSYSYSIQIQVHLPGHYATIQALENSNNSAFLNNRLPASSVKSIIASLKPASS